MIGIAEAFSARYAEARKKFLEAAAIAGLRTESFIHPLQGIEGETLAVDVALDGPADAHRLLLLTSACHGVEGHCGSGVQVFALHDQEWRDKARDAGVAVLYVHALNPYGFSHTQRSTHENIDLNRNVRDFGQPPSAQPGQAATNAAYSALHPLLLPTQWPPDAANTAALDAAMAALGPAAYQAAVTAGQTAHADGLFYGGTAPSWSQQTFRSILRNYATRARQLAWIDVHTGLGPNGIASRIFAGVDEPVALARARAWWSGGGATPVTADFEGTSPSAPLTGELFHAVYAECPGAETTALTLEVGTQPLSDMLQALRAGHWLLQHPEAPPTLAAQIRQQVRDAFYTDTDAWKGQVISQARQAMFQAVEGLNS